MPSTAIETSSSRVSGVSASRTSVHGRHVEHTSTRDLAEVSSSLATVQSRACPGTCSIARANGRVRGHLPRGGRLHAQSAGGEGLVTMCEAMKPTNRKQRVRAHSCVGPADRAWAGLPCAFGAVERAPLAPVTAYSMFARKMRGKYESQEEICCRENLLALFLNFSPEGAFHWGQKTSETSWIVGVEISRPGS